VQANEEKRRNVVASGKTVQDAITNGLQMLGVRRERVEVEVLSEGSRGVLGFGAEHARVRLVVKELPAPRVRAPQPKPTVAPVRERPAPEPARPVVPAVVDPEEDAGARPESARGPAPEQAGHEILSELLRLMDIRAKVESCLEPELAEEGQPPPAVLNITGDDLGILIGRRGETLKALQYLVRLMVSHRLKHWTNLIVDVERYRVRRRRALESLAQRVAEEVVRTGRTQALEPMNAYDRRLVHIALRKDPRVATQSVGEGERRKVTVIFTG
jgi:spoIIIJ-associated protein